MKGEVFITTMLEHLPSTITRPMTNMFITTSDKVFIVLCCALKEKNQTRLSIQVSVRRGPYKCRCNAHHRKILYLTGSDYII